jgi:hypothetical protein
MAFPAPLTGGEKYPILSEVRNNDLKDSRRFDGSGLGKKEHRIAEISAL